VSEYNESSGGFKKQNFTAEASLTNIVMHDSGFGSIREYFAECVATITDPSRLKTNEGDMVSDRQIPCRINPKSGDISRAVSRHGELSFIPGTQTPDGENLSQISFGMHLEISESEFQRFWDYQIADQKPTVSAKLTFRGHIERDHLVLRRFTWKTQDYTGEGHAYLRILSVNLDYQWGDKSSESM